MPIRYMEGNCLLSANAAWAYHRIPTASYDLLSTGERESLLFTIAGGLAALREGDCHLLVVPRWYRQDEWARALDDATPDPAPGWQDYLGKLEDEVANLAFWRREVFLGVRLGNRRQRSLLALRRRFEEAAGLEDPELCAREVATVWAPKATAVERLLGASGLGARAATAQDLRWLIRRCFWRGVGEPAAGRTARLWGGGLQALASGTILNTRSSLLLQHPEGEAHLAFLAFAELPDSFPFPGGEWLHHFDSLAFPVEASVRFRLVPAREAGSHIRAKLAEANDQARHIGGSSSDMPLALIESISRARELEYRITRERTPLVYSWPRLAVAAESAAQLDERVTELVELYRDLGTELVRPTADQLSLFREAIPGCDVQVRPYEQRKALVTLAGSMFVATSDLGDGQGPYLGETSGRTRTPVHFDPLLAAQRNLPTAIAVTGAPGGGKTNLALLMLYQLALRGAWCLHVDPKNETGRVAELPGLGKVNRLELARSQAGVLDPWSVSQDKDEGALLAVDVLRLLLPSLAPEAESALLGACRSVAELPRPSLAAVRGTLARGDTNARRLAETLSYFEELPLAKLCFSPGGGQPLAPEGHLTILQIEGINLPAAGTPKEDYTLADRLAVVVMFLVTALARRLADSSRAQAKAVVLDEAWAITGSRQGRALVERLARTGRSKNTALILVTQNAHDLLDERITNNLSAKFAFRSTEEQEIRSVLKLLDVEAAPEHFARVRALRNGECLFRDTDGRVGTLKVELVMPELAAAFNTTPARPTRAPAAVH
jgi:AAA domain-containing protein